MNIILAGNFPWSESDLQVLSASGRNHLIILHNEAEPLPVSEAEIGGIVCNWFFKYHPIEKFTNLKFIQFLSAGYNGISPEEIEKTGIPVFMAKDVYSIPISEFVTGRILSFYKKESFFLENQKNSKWQKTRDLEEISDKSILITGTGSIGNEIAKRLGAFTENVCGCTRTLREDQRYKKIYPLDQLPEIVGLFDVVIISIALADSTRHLFDHRVLSAMKPSALLVNISRGALIDEKVLTEKLAMGEIGGAILDVFEEEPLSADSPLWKMENVLISPHNSFASPKNNGRLRAVIYRNLAGIGIIDEKDADRSH